LTKVEGHGIYVAMSPDCLKKARFGPVGASFATALIVLLLALAPFAAALEIHHVFAEADQDGHEHSEFDLCQWVQLHSAGSSDVIVLDIGTLAPPREYDPPVPAVGCSAVVLSSSSSRAPPRS